VTHKSGEKRWLCAQSSNKFKRFVFRIDELVEAMYTPSDSRQIEDKYENMMVMIALKMMMIMMMIIMMMMMIMEFIFMMMMIMTVIMMVTVIDVIIDDNDILRWW